MNNNNVGEHGRWRKEISTDNGNHVVNNCGIFKNAMLFLLAVCLLDYAGIVPFFSRYAILWVLVN